MNDLPRVGTRQRGGRESVDRQSSDHLLLRRPVCSFVLFDVFMCPAHSFIFPWAVESSLFTVFGAGVTNLNEPPRDLATSTIMWAVVNKSNAG